MALAMVSAFTASNWRNPLRKCRYKGLAPSACTIASLGRRLIKPTWSISSKSLAKGGTVAQIAAGHDDPIWYLPAQLLQRFKHDGFLTFEAEGIDRIQKIDAELFRNKTHEFHIAVEIGVDLQTGRAECDALRQLPQARFADFARR